MRGRQHKIAALLCVLAASALLGTGCTTYKWARSVKTVAFDDDVKKGTGVGPIEGQDCIWMVLGYWLGGQPTLDRAFADARKQHQVRYINNVSSERDGFNAGIVGKSCLVVKGTGYK